MQSHHPHHCDPSSGVLVLTAANFRLSASATPPPSPAPNNFRQVFNVDLFSQVAPPLVHLFDDMGNSEGQLGWYGVLSGTSICDASQRNPNNRRLQVEIKSPNGGNNVCILFCIHCAVAAARIRHN